MKIFQIIFFLFLTNVALSQVEIRSEDAKKHIGEKVLVKNAKVMGVFDKSPKIIVLNVNKDFPDQDFQIVIFQNDFEKFKDYKKFEGKTVNIMGEMKLYEKYKQAQIILKEVEQIDIVE